MQILTIRKEFDAFKCKIYPFERDSEYLNANFDNSNVIWSIRMQILTIRNGFEAFECKFEPFQPNSIIRTQIQTIRTRNETFECKC